MKWITLTFTLSLLTACACCPHRANIEYRPVISPPTAVVTPPAYYDPVRVIDEDPVDVTTTTMDIY